LAATILGKAFTRVRHQGFPLPEFANCFEAKLFLFVKGLFTDTLLCPSTGAWMKQQGVPCFLHFLGVLVS
jgi:hypothetical protein